MIAILDYGMGNLKSVSKALEAVGAECQVTRDPKLISKSQKLVVPGVGHFKDCMNNLTEMKLIQPIKDFIQSGRPYLGICLGMQILMEVGEEGELTPGLGIFKGRVKRFSNELNLKIPHMGWNALQKKKGTLLFQQLPKEAYVYFVHSYYVEPEDSSIVAATSDYGVPFVSSLAYKNIFAVQFHPEKSQKIGLKILENFSKL